MVARFGLFLQQLLVMQSASSEQPYGLSLWFGTGLIAVGVVVTVFAEWNHIGLLWQLGSRRSAELSPVHQLGWGNCLLPGIGGTGNGNLVSIRSSTHAPTGNDKDKTAMEMNSNGLVTTPSNHTVDQTVEKLKGILAAKGVALFALIDHSGEAEKAGLKMRPTKLLIFGNPRAGTPLMVAAPGIAIDLPLKILVWEDDQQQVQITYNSPEYLQQRHGVPKELLENIAVVGTMATQAGQ